MTLKQILKSLIIQTNKFLNQKMEIIKTDQISVKTKIKSNEIKSLFNIEKLREIINSTETIYFMSNN